MQQDILCSGVQGWMRPQTGVWQLWKGRHTASRTLATSCAFVHLTGAPHSGAAQRSPMGFQAASAQLADAQPSPAPHRHTADGEEEDGEVMLKSMRETARPLASAFRTRHCVSA